MRSLDIDKVIEALRSNYNNGTCRGVDYDQTDAAAFEEALEGAYKEYGIEAEPVRYGKWELFERREPQYDLLGVKTWGMVYRCSECHFLHTVIEDFGQYPYCPHCGAQMEEQEV